MASAQTFADGFRPAITVAAAISLAGAIAGLWLPGRTAGTTTQAQHVPATTEGMIRSAPPR